MALRTRLIAGSAAVVLGSLLLAGCSGNADESIDLSDSSAPIASSAPEGTSGINATEETPTEDVSQAPSGSGEVPSIGDTVVEEKYVGTVEEGMDKEIVYSGDSTNIAALKDSFEAKGFIWNDVNGDGTYIIASSVKANVTLVDNMNGTYSYTSFKGE